MLDEGYIKFKPNWVQSSAFAGEKLAGIISARQQLYQHKLIGAYPSGIGYGNISIRHPLPENPDAFLISGSATGNYPILTNQHFALVENIQIEENSLNCSGPIVASSESMSHAVVYQECPEVMAVVHIHSSTMWERLLHRVPTTDAQAAYGTPEMARSIVQLLQETDLRKNKLFVMEGHEEGVFTFGKSLEEAVKIILENIN